MKTLKNLLFIAILLALTSFSATEPNVNATIVGEWSSLIKGQPVERVTFFSTGMVHIVVKGHYHITAKYNIDNLRKSTSNQITGQMYPTNGIFHTENSDNDKASPASSHQKNTVAFTVSIKDGDKMSLLLGKNTSTKAVSLVKTRDISSGITFIK